VRYEAVNAMLLNEFLKAHRKLEELKATAARQEASILQQKEAFEVTTAKQQKQIEALTKHLQQVSEQIETSRPAPQLATSN
jgi:hypothetical protein